jgi:hypothetical protein
MSWASYTHGASRAARNGPAPEAGRRACRDAAAHPEVGFALERATAFPDRCGKRPKPCQLWRLPGSPVHAPSRASASLPAVERQQAAAGAQLNAAAHQTITATCTSRQAGGANGHLAITVCWASRGTITGTDPRAPGITSAIGRLAHGSGAIAARLCTGGERVGEPGVVDRRVTWWACRGELAAIRGWLVAVWAEGRADERRGYARTPPRMRRYRRCSEVRNHC